MTLTMDITLNDLYNFTLFFTVVIYINTFDSRIRYITIVIFILSAGLTKYVQYNVLNYYRDVICFLLLYYFFGSMIEQKKYNTAKYDSKLSTNDDCTICLEKFDNNDIVLLLSCTHSYNFHSTCITKWLEVKNRCPLCYKEF